MKDFVVFLLAKKSQGDRVAKKTNDASDHGE